MTMDEGQLLEMYRRMVLIRRFEETTRDLFMRGMVKGGVCSCLGQEATAVGVCMALDEDDLIAGTHRSHGHMMAKGCTPNSLMAEILGKATGCCRGRGGSMHVADFSVGSLGALAIVGAGMPIAVGAALGFKMQGKDRVSAAFFGDGASNTGNFHESLNMASIWDLPVLFILENNRYAVSTQIERSAKITDLSVRASSYGIPGVRVDGNDVLAVYQAASSAIERARRGEGPTLLVTETYRIEGHYAGEPQVYRDRSEVDAWRQKDPITRFRQHLVEESGISKQEIEAIDADSLVQIEKAVEFALESPEPDASTAMCYIYA